MKIRIQYRRGMGKMDEYQSEFTMEVVKWSISHGALIYTIEDRTTAVPLDLLVCVTEVEGDQID